MGSVLKFPEAPAGIIDTTSRILCKKFSEYIYLYEVMTQLTRLAYCDSGIIKKVFDTDFGKDNFTVMQKISELDTAYVGERRRPLIQQKSSSITAGIPHESYALGPVPDIKKHKYGTYISTHEALTAFVIDTTTANKILLNNGPFIESDVILTFKGTNTAKEIIHDLKSASSRVDIYDTAKSLGFTPGEDDRESYINGSFTAILVDAWDVLIQAVTEHSGTGAFRLFVTGHSLGGAYCTLFGFILGYLKTLPPDYESQTTKLLNRIQSIHVISLGSPTVCADKARNLLNRGLTSGLMTYDRLVTQKIATLTPQAVGTDVVALIPSGFSHPGFKQKAELFSKQDKRRPFKLSSIYHLYGQGEPKNYRMKEVTKEQIEQAQQVTGTVAPPVAEDKAPLLATTGGRRLQKGGFFQGPQKRAYEAMALKYSSNFISVPAQGITGSLVPHFVYFGLQYVTSFRLVGMKNPVPSTAKQCAYFGFYDDPDAGVLISYVYCSGRKILSARRNTTQRFRGIFSGTAVSAQAQGQGQASVQNTNGREEKPTKKFTRKRINTWLLGGKRRAEF